MQYKNGRHMNEKYGFALTVFLCGVEDFKKRSKSNLVENRSLL
jgi:hypothetical protein